LTLLAKIIKIKWHLFIFIEYNEKKWSIMGKYFGTDGFRGEANVDLTAEHAFKVGRFLGYYFGTLKKDNENIKIVIGKDTRLSSYMFEYALAGGITASGADAYLLHVTTTACVSYVVTSEGFDCGIMISASHNPYFDNGIKLIGSNGMKISEEIELKIEEYLDGKIAELPLAKREKIGKSVDFAAGRNRYIGHLIALATRSYKDIKIGLDLANGSSFNIGKHVFDALLAKTYVINNEPNGLNINVNCGSTHIEALQKSVKENSLDVGFAFDGDADRCFVVDDKGEILDGDGILYICGKYLKDNSQLKDNTVVTTVMSNIGLIKAFEDIGIHCEITDVGDRNVCERMIQNGYSLGGEQSGHIIFSKYETTGDGILTAIMIMEVLLYSKQKLSKLKENLIIYPQVLKNVKVKNKEKALAANELKVAIENAEKKLGDDGRVLIRASGTESLIRVMAEAKDKELCNSVVDELVAVVEEGQNA